MFMASGRNNVSQIVRGSLFFDIKYETPKEVISVFVEVVTAVLVSLTLYIPRSFLS
jgi:hypothetical protein